MIRYDVDHAEVVSRVGKLIVGWTDRAEARTAALIEQGAYGEPSSIWSEVKPVFMELQHQKCVYCERQFESAEYGKIEFDLEHFRPKSEVRAWTPSDPDLPQAAAGGFGAASDHGYYWMAYDLRNYAASCKVCNSPLKASYFPILSQRAEYPCEFKDLSSESHVLCYPIGHDDEDPENLIRFVATTAVPVHDSGARNVRARAIIDFFDLNRREQLHKQRAQLIAVLGSCLKQRDEGRDVNENIQVADLMTHSSMPHSSCLRSFRRTWDGDAAVGEEVLRRCRRIIVGLEKALGK